MILRLDQVELRLMCVVVVSDVLVGNVNLRRHLFVQNLVHRQLPAQVTFEVVEREFLFLQTGVELLFCVRRLDLVQLAFDLVISGQEPKFLGAAHQDFKIYQLMQDAEMQAGGLFSRRLLRGTRSLVFVVLLEIRAGNLAAVNRGCNIVTRHFGPTTQGHREKWNRKQYCKEETKSRISLQSGPLGTTCWGMVTRVVTRLKAKLLRGETVPVRRPASKLNPGQLAIRRWEALHPFPLR